MLELRMNELYEKDPNDNILVELSEIQLGLNLEADKEKLFWEQRARVNWLTNGDKNNTFFHKVVSGRKKCNKIISIEGGEGRWVFEEEKVMEISSIYFIERFTTSLVGYASWIYANVQRKISPDINEELLLPFRLEEIWVAVRSMVPIKALGMMLWLGFHDNWVTLVMRCVTSVSYTVGLNEGTSDRFLPLRGGYILFSDASREGVENFHKVVLEYKNASGQKVAFWEFGFQQTQRSM
ncbi:hypothetical protein PVK06_023269 [Gossypium arboreum]|uniref:Uncharacterized protein n=1 Tax=Gossypium arboreum TaxID=29729 RepID=A0ABR0PAQ8_GOSAR|nr:hypothetical protein PVK06_023269 [Gossypium arboreum]